MGVQRGSATAKQCTAGGQPHGLWSSWHSLSLVVCLQTFHQPAKQHHRCEGGVHDYGLYRTFPGYLKSFGSRSFGCSHWSAQLLWGTSHPRYNSIVIPGDGLGKRWETGSILPPVSMCCLKQLLQVAYQYCWWCIRDKLVVSFWAES